MTSTVSPCPYPGCRDEEGNPRLTRDGICMSSRRHYATVLDRLRDNWLTLHSLMPAPSSTGVRVMVKSGEKTYGHPREWASDGKRAIVDHFSDAHRALAENLRHKPPVGPDVAEIVRVKQSHHYLTSWFAELCSYPFAGSAAIAFHDLDRQIRSGLGETQRRIRVDVPCPQCELLALVRVVDIDGGDGGVECRNPECGRETGRDAYRDWTKFLVGNVLVTAAPDTAVAG